MKKIENAFQEFELTEAEDTQGRILNIYQRARLQNILADFAKQKLRLPFAPENALLAAELDGKCLLLEQLLEDATTAETPATPTPT